MNTRTTILKSLIALTVGCVSHDAATPAVDEPATEQLFADERASEAGGVPESAVLAADAATCPPFRDPGATSKERQARLRYLNRSAATMGPEEPAFAESLLFLAEYNFAEGSVAAGCGALDRLMAEADDGEFHAIGRCWHEARCVVAAEIRCAAGHTLHDHKGCAPETSCDVDRGDDIEAAVAGACVGGDVACCVVESNVAQAHAIAARREGDAKRERRHLEKMNELLTRSCDLGTASSCAFLAEQYREHDATGDGDAARARLSTRACVLGHTASCP